MGILLLLPCTDTAPSGVAGCGVTWGSRTLLQLLLQFVLVLSCKVQFVMVLNWGERWDGGMEHWTGRALLEVAGQVQTDAIIHPAGALPAARVRGQGAGCAFPLG